MSERPRRRQNMKSGKKAKSASSSAGMGPKLLLPILLGVLVVGLVVLFWQRRGGPQNAGPADPAGASVPGPPAATTPWDRAKLVWTKEVKDLEPKIQAEIQLRRSRSALGKFQFVANPIQVSDLRQIEARFRKKDLDEYRQKSSDAGAARDAAIAYLEAFLSEIESPPVGDPPSLKLAEAAEAAGATDPIFVVNSVVAKLLAGQRAYALNRLLEAALKQLDARQGSPLASFEGWRVLAQIAEQNHAGNRPALAKSAVDAAQRLVKSRSADPAELRLICSRMAPLYNSVDSPFIRDMIVSFTETEGLDPWFRHYWVGRILTDEAWSIRGQDTVDKVAPRMLELFEEYQRDAARHFEVAWYLHPEIPEAAMELLGISRTIADSSNTEFWFHEVVDRYPDLSAPYRSWLTALLPRWGGSYEAQLQFGHECLETGRFDLGVPQQFLEACRFIERDLKDLNLDPRLLYVTPGFQKGLQQLCTGVLKPGSANTPPAKSLSAVHRTSLFRYLVTLGEFPRVKDFLDATDGPWDDTQFDGWDLSGGALRAWAREMAGDRAGEFGELRTDYARWNANPNDKDLADQFVARFQRVRKAVPGRNEFLELIESRAIARLSFDRGEWISLPCDGTDRDVWRYHCSWHKHTDSAVELGATGQNDGIQMVLKQQFPPPYELEATFERPRSETLKLMVGILIGDADLREPQGPLAAIALGDRDVRIPDTTIESLAVGAAPMTSQFNPLTVTIRHRPAQKLGVVVWPDYFEGIYAGQSISPSVLQNMTPVQLNPQVTLGWWVPSPGWGDQQIRVSNIRIRKVLYGPPPSPLAPALQQIAYYDEAIKQQPDTPRLHVSLAKLHSQSDTPKAIAAADKALELDPNVVIAHSIKGIARMQQGDFAAALREFDAEYAADASGLVAYLYLVQLLCAVPDENLRDAARARQVFTIHSALKPSPQWARAEAVLAGAEGDFSRALDLLKQVEQMPNDDEDREWIAQQKRAFTQKRPFRFAPLTRQKR